jgi:hypothetical protein
MFFIVLNITPTDYGDSAGKKQYESSHNIHAILRRHTAEVKESEANRNIGKHGS